MSLPPTYHQTGPNKCLKCLMKIDETCNTMLKKQQQQLLLIEFLLNFGMEFI